MKTKHKQLLNLALLASGPVVGFQSMAPEELQHMNPDVYLCITVLLFMPLFAWLSTTFAIKRDPDLVLHRPKLDRLPLNWWRDPLQGLWFSMMATGGLVVGSALRLRGTTATGVWLFATYLSMFLGLRVGVSFVYRRYHEKVRDV
jgi:hypothetical protein